MASFPPTAEQASIISAAREGRHSMILRAYAGSGKTSTLELLTREAITSEPVLYIVFNKKNQREAEERFPPHVQPKTANSLGHGALSRGLGKRLVMDDRKVGRLTTEALRTIPRNEQDPELWGLVKDLVVKAMQAGIVPERFASRATGLVPNDDTTWQSLTESAPTADTIALARGVLGSAIAEGLNGVISFDEQIYLSVLFGGMFPRFPTVLVDESQDLSLLQHRMIARCAADRIIAVGDERQGIYAWRGADAASMAKLKSLRTEWLEFPLATTFRCPKLVVARSAGHAPGFTAHASNREGRCWNLPLATKHIGGESSTWDWSDVEALAEPGPIAVLCRNNAPLMSLAFKLIRAGVGCSVAGRDLAGGLEGLMKKLSGSAGLDGLSVADFLAKLTDWRDRESTLALANDDGPRAESIADKAECILAIAEGDPTARTPGGLVIRLRDLFSRENSRVLLSSIHRAKGLEFPTVLHLDPWRIPSKFAKRRGGETLQQEFNLLYVAETRTQHTLIEASLEDYQ
jgi:DNA helicase II / ATP-dependent DNA helicase PcrA